MKTINFSLVSILFLFTTLFSYSLVQAAYDDGDDYEEVGYESLISELTKSRFKQQSYVPQKSSSSLMDSEIHLGLGMVTALMHVNQNINLPQYTTKYVEDPKGIYVGNGKNGTTKDKLYRKDQVITGYQSEDAQFVTGGKGVQVGLGIDLLNRNWKAEGTLRSYETISSDDFDLFLKEFDLKLVYQRFISSQMQFSGGGGLAARYLTLEHHISQQKFDHTTPSSILFLGLHYHITGGFSLGGEVSRRSAMISDTADHDVYDLTLRLDTHF